MGKAIESSTMASKFTFEMPDELRAKMDAHPEVNWSEVLRQAVHRHADTLELAQRIQREMEDPDVRELAEEITRRAARRYEADLDEDRG